MRSEENWRLRVDAPWTLACVAILLATLGVHYTALSEDRTDLALPELIHTMETKCHALGDTFDAAAAASAPPSHPVPTQFGVAVWVEQQAWALPVHDALDRIEAAVGRAVVADATNRRYIQRIVRVTTNASWRRVRISSGDHAAFALVAAKQQLGLGVAKHVYAVDLREELRMHGISFFRDTSSASSAEAAGLRCFLFETRQAYCTVNANASAEWLQREVPAAVATLMAGWLGVGR
ncbi:GPI transamidase component Tta1 [Trypanosoma grayi]|uniref:GPI transamidase component Tta1 n=1 Tax=Trypanosoma grayi TaxID=71804 RepID=UPI0004F47EB9|nr:GPI transamidase component Tta1 [Trypanosoma grayi]KEG09154.1 GPI transamidase component Tta1 [Trypanosoma grayi]